MLFRNPLHPYTKALVSAVPIPDPGQRLDLRALMEGKASDPKEWPAPFKDEYAEVNGVKLQGNITWFDNFCVLLRRDGQMQLVYKHAISTVMPMGPVQLQDQEIGATEEA